MIHVKPNVTHFTLQPVLGILATADVTLESLIGGLRDQFPEINDGPPEHTDSRDMHSNVRAAIALAQALQVLVSRICTDQMEIVDPSDDCLF
jgi:hypothetical protein